MKRLILLLITISAPFMALAGFPQDGNNTDMMDGQCPMCGGPWHTSQSWNGQLPIELPAPKNKVWISRLQEILAIEKYSKLQYEADAQKYQIRMPYLRIIPQERSHILWISGLFKAYKIPSDGKVSPIQQTNSVDQAYELGQKLEANVIQRYVWLIRNTDDNTSKRILDTILLQSRMHYMLFTHALEMGGMGMWR